MVLNWIKRWLSQWTDHPIYKGMGLTVSDDPSQTTCPFDDETSDTASQVLEQQVLNSKTILEKCNRIAQCHIKPNNTVYDIVGMYRNEQHDVVYYKLQDPISGEEINIGRIHFKKFFTVDKK